MINSNERIRLVIIGMLIAVAFTILGIIIDSGNLGLSNKHPQQIENLKST